MRNPSGPMATGVRRVRARVLRKIRRPIDTVLRAIKGRPQTCRGKWRLPLLGCVRQVVQIGGQGLRVKRPF